MGGVAIFHAVPREVRAKGRPRGRGHEQHKGRRHHIMRETGQRHLIGAHTAPRHVFAFQEQHPLPLQPQHRACDQRVDARADDDVICGHGLACHQSQRADRRTGAVFDLQRSRNQDRAFGRQFVPVSYTHLDVYKRQLLIAGNLRRIKK